MSTPHASGEPSVTIPQTDQRGMAPSTRAAYRDLFLRSTESILLVDIASGTIIEANDAAAALFRSDLEPLVGKSIYVYPREDFRREFEKMIRIATRRYHPKIFEVPLILSSEKGPIERHTEMAASPLLLNDGTEVLQLFFTTSPRRKKLKPRSRSTSLKSRPPIRSSKRWRRPMA